MEEEIKRESRVKREKITNENERKCKKMIKGTV